MIFKAPECVVGGPAPTYLGVTGRLPGGYIRNLSPTSPSPAHRITVSSTTAGPPETPQRHHPMDTPTTVNAGGGKAADPVLLDWEAGPRAASIL